MEKYGLDSNLVFGPSAIVDVFDSLSAIRGENLHQTSNRLKAMTQGLAMETANIYTYRTPHYQLSGVQDHQKGWNCFQEFPWQATLSSDAYVFTSSPSGLCKDPGRWIGGWLPKATLYQNVGVIQYDRKNLPLELELIFWALGHGDETGINREDYNHAYFPKWQFTNVIQKNSWTFGQVNESYIGLYSYKPTTWRTDYELLAKGKKNVWVVEMGSQDEFGSFDSFTSQISDAPLSVTPDPLGYSVNYQSPSQGKVDVSWNGDMIVNGSVIPTSDYKRYENQYSTQEFGTTRTEIEFNNTRLILDFEEEIRITESLS